MSHIEQLSSQLHIDIPDLIKLLKSLYEIMCDQDFIKQVLAINDDITLMSADN